MNHTYRLVWNASLRVIQVASEMACLGASRAVGARPSSRPARFHVLAAALALGLAAPSCAVLAATLPTGPTVVSGAATITGDVNSLIVTQSSQALSIDWTSFDIGVGGSVTFTQPASGLAEHRVLGGTASQIDGTWLAQGTQTLTNGNGIALGATARVTSDYLKLSAGSTTQSVTLAAGAEVNGQAVDSSLELFGAGIHTDANVDVYELRATAWRDDIVQTQGVITAGNVDVSAAGDAHLDGYNRIATLSASAGGDLSVRNADDIFMNTLRVGGKTDLNSDGSLTARDANNALAGQVTVTAAWDAAINNTLPTLLGPSRAHTFVVMAPGIRLQGDTMASLGLTLFSENRPIVQESGRVYANSSATLDAGTADITLDSPNNVFYTSGSLTATGGNIRIAASTLLSFGDVTATGQLHASPGYPNPMVEFRGRTVASDILVDGDLWVYAPFGTSESVKGDLALSGRLIFGGGFATQVFNGDITGDSSLHMEGTAAVEALNGRTQVQGPTYAHAGTLLIGDATHPGALLVSDAIVNGGTLGGTGRIDGDVTVQAGGYLAPGDGIGTLTVDGALTFERFGRLAVDVGLPGMNAASAGRSDLVHVLGDVFVDNAFIDIANAGGMGAGLYTVLDYTGHYVEANGGFRVDNAPSGTAFQVLNNVGAKRIDLLNVNNVAVNFWNGDGATGGSGVWNALTPNWTSPDGTRTDIMTPQPGYAVFTNARGDVHVDNTGGAVTASGLQFATDGYTVSGDALTLLSGSGTTPVIRVGQGTPDSAGMVATLSNVLRGTQGLKKDDYGTLVLTGANTYSGGTTVARGVLAVADDRALGEGNGSLTLDGGTLRIDGTVFESTRRGIVLGASGGGLSIADASNTFTLAQAIGGTGGLVKSGAGTLAMTGTNTYAGGTTVNAGTLRGNTNSIHDYLFNDATVVFDQPFDGTFNGSIHGSGALVKEGQGTLVFLGDGGFSGPTRIAAGQLQVGSSDAPNTRLAGSVDVAAGARLSGVGSIQGNLMSYGTVAPGAPIGVLSVAGDATLASGSTLFIDTTPEGASRLAVGGTLTIDNARLVVDSQGRDWMVDTPYDLVVAGGVSGRFAAVNTDFVFLNAIVAYDSRGGVQLNLRRNAVSFVDAAITPNQRATAVAVDALGAGNTLYDRVVTFDTNDARAAFTSLSGDLHASTQTLVIDDQRQVRDAVSRHLLGGDDAYDGVRGDDGRGTGAWFTVLGHDADYDGDGNAAKVDGSGSGALLGVDVMLDSDARIGAVLGHAKQTLHERSVDGSADVRSNTFGLYGDAPFGAFTLRGGAAYARHTIDTNRRLASAVGDSGLRASRDANSSQVFAELGYAFHPGERVRLEPFAQVASLGWSGDDADERGGVGALRVHGDDARVTTSKLGMHVASAFTPTGSWGLQATVAWQHASGDTTPKTRLSFADGGAGFVVAGVPLAKNATTVDAGLSFRLSPAVRLDVSYAGQYASGVSEHGGRATLGVAL